MVTFQQKKPHPSLSNYIRGYWLLETGHQAETLDLVPDGYPEIFFTLQGSVQIFAGSKPWEQYAQAGIIGQVTSRVTFETAAGSKVLYVKLYPWTPAILFHLPAWQLNNSVQEMDALTRHQAFRSLSEQVYKASHFDQAAALLDAFFTKRLATIAVESPFLQHAVQQIYTSHGTVSIDRLTENIHASRRYVELLFKEKIGLTPKQYARLIRVKKSTMLMLGGEFSGQINRVAGSLNYYDQSHFLKDFKAVTQQTPTEFLQQQLNIATESVHAYLGQWDYS